MQMAKHTFKFLIPLLMALSMPAWAASSTALDSLSKIHEVTNELAADHPTVDFEATVSYYRGYEHTLFVQDGNFAVYVYSPREFNFEAGDRLHIRGSLAPSFHPIVSASDITLVRHAEPLDPIPATYADLSHANLDGRLVTVRARVESADISVSTDRPDTKLVLRMQGGPLEAYVDNSDPALLAGLLDAEVEIAGVTSGRFGGKMEMTGVLLHVSSMNNIRVLKRSSTDPWTIPMTPADRIFSAFSEDIHSNRVRVKGIITYYYPGSAVVLQEGTHAIWVKTHTREKLTIGARAEATGFPDAHDGFLRIREGEVRDTHAPGYISPVPVNWVDLAQSKHLFELATIEVRVVAEVREAARDTYVLNSEGHIFSAIYRHPEQRMLRAVPLPPLKEIPIGSTVKVTGICILEDPNPYNGAVPVELMLRTSDDLQVIAKPSPITVANLVRVTSLLVIGLLGIGAWVWALRRRVHQQTRVIAKTATAESARERRNAQVEQRRAQILERINQAIPLSEILTEITDLVAFQLNGTPCWAELSDGTRIGRLPEHTEQLRIKSEDIVSHVGPRAGILYAGFQPGSQESPDEQYAFHTGTRLITVAMETRRLYADLVRRSEFDLLTDIHNRFSLESRLQTVIEEAERTGSTFGLIFIDLDEFKRVNDLHGHHTGDLYLQEVAARMKSRLRGGDLLARLGGDEFAVLVPAARSHRDLNDVAERLRRCFDTPFTLESLTISGSASFGYALYPDDGSTNDTLLSAADAAMYVAKNTGHEHCDRPEEAASSHFHP